MTLTGAGNALDMPMITGSNRAFIGLGSNLGDPQAQVRSAFEEIAAVQGVLLCKRSSLYLSAPVGCSAQPDFINAVAEIRTVLAPLRLLDVLQAIERRHGRVRHFRNSARTLDLDILSYGDLRCRSEELVLPHPRAHKRAFVLQPLLEIAPDCVMPGLGPIRTWTRLCRDQAVTRIPADPVRSAEQRPLAEVG